MSAGDYCPCKLQSVKQMAQAKTKVQQAKAIERLLEQDDLDLMEGASSDDILAYKDFIADVNSALRGIKGGEASESASSTCTN